MFVVIFFKTMDNKTITRFGFCDILNNQGLGNCYQSRPSVRLVTLTTTYIIPDIKSTSSNNCFKICQYKRSRLCLFILDNRKWGKIFLKETIMENCGWKWSRNNDEKIVGTRTVHFTWLKSSPRFERINKLVSEYTFCSLNTTWHFFFSISQ